MADALRSLPACGKWLGGVEDLLVDAPSRLEPAGSSIEWPGGFGRSLATRRCHGLRALLEGDDEPADIEDTDDDREGHQDNGTDDEWNA